MTEADDDMVARPTVSYPPAQMTPAEFEVFVVDLIRAANPDVSGLDIRLHDKITGDDGTYDFDATIRFDFGGMTFLVLVEAKHHVNPIKRELVQVLHQKIQSVGGHKGVMIATAPYQKGALAFAKAHGIALVTVTEGRFLYAVRTKVQPPVMSRQQADLLGIVPFAGTSSGPARRRAQRGPHLSPPTTRITSQSSSWAARREIDGRSTRSPRVMAHIEHTLPGTCARSPASGSGTASDVDPAANVVAIQPLLAIERLCSRDW